MSLLTSCRGLLLLALWTLVLSQLERAEGATITDMGLWRIQTVAAATNFFLGGCDSPAGVCTQVTGSTAATSDFLMGVAVRLDQVGDGDFTEWRFIRPDGTVGNVYSITWNAATKCWTDSQFSQSCCPTCNPPVSALWTAASSFAHCGGPQAGWRIDISNNGIPVLSEPFALQHDPSSFLAITSPLDNRTAANNQLQQMTQQTSTAAQVPFTAVTSSGNSVTWAANFSPYQTGAGYPNPPGTDAPRSFSTATGVEHDETYQSLGGQVQVTAQTSTPFGTMSDCATFYIEGPHNIDPSVTTSQIVASYTSSASRSYPSGGTPNLLTGIAMHEGTYHQFWTPTSTPNPNEDLYGLYSKLGIAAYWPHESFDSGTHIGLMQVPTTMADAWNWLTNVNSGMSVFSGGPAAVENKVDAAIRYEGYIRNGKNGNPKINPWTPTPPALNGVQRENNALVLYRGAGFDGNLAHTLERLYYRAVCSGTVQDTNTQHKCVGGTWSWQENHDNQPVGFDYVSFPGSPTVQPGIRYQLQ
jgi:hypothetical protein